MATARMFRKFAHMHTTHPEIKPLTFSVTFGSICAAIFPIYSYCQNMEFGYGKDYATNGQMQWYNYIIPTKRKRYSENDDQVEKLKQELFKETNKPQ